MERVIIKGAIDVTIDLMNKMQAEMQEHGCVRPTGSLPFKLQIKPEVVANKDIVNCKATLVLEPYANEATPIQAVETDTES